MEKNKRIFAKYIILAIYAALLVLIRVIFKQFGISIGYLYIPLIFLCGYWFGLAGGLISAFFSSVIFILELNIFHYFPFSDIDRALAEVEPRGCVKLIVHKGKILGASILGSHAGELIHEIVLAMKTGAGIGDISATIHAYPTLSQVHRRTVNTWYGKKLFNPATRRLVRWINRLLP